MQNSFYISEPFLFAPGLDSTDDWKLWAQNKKEISIEKTAPALSYTDPLFRRRLSQLSRMTVDVVHNLLESTKIDSNTKIVFVSFRGEIDREFKINKSIIEDEMILPAGFSLSVFNAPIALATIACGLKAGYNCIFPSYDNFRDGLLCAVSSVLSENLDKLIFVYGDEMIPAEYEKVVTETKPPVAFSVIISKDKIQNTNSVKYELEDICQNVYDFIRLHINKCYN